MEAHLVTKLDWIEDFDSTDDNGDYQHTCQHCGLTYRGHKRNVGSCKRCWVKFASKFIAEHRQQQRQVCMDAECLDDKEHYAH